MLRHRAAAFNGSFVESVRSSAFGQEQSVAASESRRSASELGRAFSNLPIVLCPGWKLRQHLFEGFLVHMTT